MESKHTSGPWAVGYLDDNDQRVVRSEHIEICTCWHHCVGSIEKEMEANARLIASAPDLLEALKDVTALYCMLANSGDCGFWDPEEVPQIKAARAAISKAENQKD